MTTDSGKKKTGEKFKIQPEEGPVIFFAGLYRIEEIRFVHDRMPVMLAKDDTEKWVRAENNVCNFPRAALIYERSAH